MLLVAAALTLAVERTINSATDVLEDLPRAVQKLRYAVTSWSRDGTGPLKQVRKTADELQKLAGAAVVNEAAPASAPPSASTAGNLFAMGTASMAIFLVQLGSVLFLTYFLLAAGNLFRQKLIQTLGPSLTRRKKALQILNDVNEVSQRYFALVFVMNVAVGLVTGFGMYLLDVRHPVFWGIVMAILHTIPYLGAGAVTGAIGLTAYLQFDSVTAALLAAAVPLAASMAIGVWLQTALMGRAVGMNAVVVFVALLFWGTIWGGWGLLLAFPIMASVKIVCGQIDRLKPIALLMSD
jgi:predicted PurR-regulated permease PerM